ncbi:MAG: nicotinic acid mononucleotide adenylyltransferase [Alphaproteobacteria bacterium]|nr:MAG: nicotinic acid mononucleotide adenylyltransferase [Alphaproteobacteria bacterium]
MAKREHKRSGDTSGDIKGLSIFPVGAWAEKKVGLLGGSFNPAHAAHLDITLSALDRLKLDAVWWLVSPQNPLKSEKGMADLQDRLASAREMATDPRIHVTDVETHLATCYTVDSLNRIMALLPDTRFIWLMGADNMAQFSQWKDWKKIARTVAFAIFDRPGYSRSVKASDAAQLFRDDQIPESQAAELSTMKAPAWTFIRDIQNPLSSTEIRRKKL